MAEVTQPGECHMTAVEDSGCGGLLAEYTVTCGAGRARHLTLVFAPRPGGDEMLMCGRDRPLPY